MKEKGFVNTASGFCEVKLRTSRKPKFRLERLDRDKHSSLFCPFEIYEEKSFLNMAPHFCKVKLRTSPKPKVRLERHDMDKHSSLF
jgi:hypothetical protein